MVTEAQWLCYVTKLARIDALRHLGASYRAIGRLLKMSPQRIWELERLHAGLRCRAHHMMRRDKQGSYRWHYVQALRAQGETH